MRRSVIALALGIVLLITITFVRANTSAPLPTTYLPSVVRIGTITTSIATPATSPTGAPPTISATNTTVPPTVTPTVTPTMPTTNDILESFEGAIGGWVVARETTGGGTIAQSTAQRTHGNASARLTVASSSDSAYLRVAFADAAGSHQWEERIPTFFWQRASLYVPASTLSKLGASGSLTIARLVPSAGGNAGWFLRVHQNGDLYVAGYTSNSQLKEFRAYATLPTDQWVSLELGLQTQNGPGVKRAFAFVLNGGFYGWFRQGNLQGETYDRAAFGLINATVNANLELYVDAWRTAGNGRLPTGPDTRSTATVQTQDFRTQNGASVQYDWSTWEFNPTLHPTYGLYTPNDRLQAGRNLDRMPDVSNGWAEIEIDWPQGTPNLAPNKYFAPMLGFHKEINREENVEVIPVSRGSGNVDLVLEAWTGDAIELAAWPLPLASIGGGSHIPEPGDTIRARWTAVSSTTLNVRVSYYDASASSWYTDTINGNFNLAAVPDNGSPGQTINYFDGYHTAASVTIDSPQYAIRRFTLGTLETYP